MKVSFADGGVAQVGYTQNLSQTGLFVTTARLPKLGAQLSVRLDIAPVPVEVHGQVVRHVVVPAELRSLKGQGFGLKFTRAPTSLAALLAPPVARPAGPCVELPTPADFERRAASELVHGGVTIESPAPRLNEELEVAFVFGWLGAVVTARGRVVHCRPTENRYLLMVVFHDKAATLQALHRAASAPSA